jgi:hypothetical protein
MIPVTFAAVKEESRKIRLFQSKFHPVLILVIVYVLVEKAKLVLKADPLVIYTSR